MTIYHLLTATTTLYKDSQLYTYRVAQKQGSVATHLRCGEIFSDTIIITNFLLILTVK